MRRLALLFLVPFALVACGAATQVREVPTASLAGTTQPVAAPASVGEKATAKLPASVIR